MGQTKFLIDTNVIFHYVSSLFDKDTRIEVGAVLKSNPASSIITYIELLSKDDALLVFAENLIVYELTESIVLETSKHKIKLPDAIIAATALVHNLSLLTHNTKDFKNIKGLAVVDPFAM